MYILGFDIGGTKCAVVTALWDGNQIKLLKKEKCCPILTSLMSGSPIIQDGKLIGAITHVFVNDPTKGYGIFIENMLAEAEKIK